VLLGLGLLACASTSWADGAEPGRRPETTSELPPGPLKRALLDAERAAREAGVGREVVARPVGEALGAVERALGARAAGDRPHAVLLEQLARQWIDVVSMLTRAAKAEAEGAAAAARAQELRKRLERARALLVEQQARRGRLEARLETLTKQAAATAKAAADVEAARLERASKNRAPGRGEGRRNKP
jgi:hypothetical protein